ncbi:hypothetical protein [Streptomyces sp. NPDC003480]
MLCLPVPPCTTVLTRRYSVGGQGAGTGSLGLVLALDTAPTIVFLPAGEVLANLLSRSRIVLGDLPAAAAPDALVASSASPDVYCVNRRRLDDY